MSGLVQRWRLMVSAIKDKRLHRSELAVLGAVLDRMDKSGVAWPSMTTIAEDAGVSRGQVIKVIPRLRDFGYLHFESGNQTASNRYTIGKQGGILQESTPRLPQNPTPRLPQASGVGSCGATEVGSPRRPELALEATNTIELDTAPAADAAVSRSRVSKKATTFIKWCESQPAGQKIIPESDPIFDYAEDVGLPYDLLALQWRVFSSKYEENPKRYTDWRAVFRNSVRGNWFKLWFIDSNGQYLLTTQGRQAEREFSMSVAA